MGAEGVLAGAHERNKAAVVGLAALIAIPMMTVLPSYIVLYDPYRAVG